MAALTPPPVTLPVGTRGWCIRDSQKSGAGATGSKPARGGKPNPRPSHCIFLETECVTTATASMSGFDAKEWAPEGQAPLFGCAVIARTLDWRIEREVIFYPDDLPEFGLAVLRKYVEHHSYRRGALPRRASDAVPDLIWRDERRVIVELLPLSKFLKLFYYISYKKQSLVIGWDLAFHLTRFAKPGFWREVKKRKHVGAWHVDLWTYRDGSTGTERPSSYRPGIIINSKAPEVVFIEFSSRRPEDEDDTIDTRHRGEFLDPANLLNALTGRHWTLPEALDTFIGTTIVANAEHGLITTNSIEHCRRQIALCRHSHRKTRRVIRSVASD
jgi:hypothetical protein